MLSGVIRSVNSSCRSKSHLTELGELPRQLLPTKGVSIKHIPAQDGLSKGTVSPAWPWESTYNRCPPLARPDLSPTPTWSSGRADGPKAQSQMFGGGSPPGCLWQQSRSCSRFCSRQRGQSWCSRQKGCGGALCSHVRWVSSSLSF